MLPWFSGLQSDLETLAPRDMVAAYLSPSGLANRYVAIPFAFLPRRSWEASAQFPTLSFVVGATTSTRWRRVLTGAKAEVDAYLEKWRKAAVNRVCEAFQLVKQAEMEKFGEKSYCYCKGNGLAYLVGRCLGWVIAPGNQV